MNPISLFPHRLIGDPWVEAINNPQVDLKFPTVLVTTAHLSDRLRALERAQ